MKYQILSYFIYVTALSNANAGDSSGGGGDKYAEEFVSLGHRIVELLTKEPLADVDKDLLYQAIKATKVHSKEKLTLNGYEVDAINYPNENPPRIVLNRSSWDSMAAYEQVFLVLHEYLGIMGIDDSNYKITQKLDRAKVCSRTPEVRETLENIIKKSCYRILRDDMRYIDYLVIAAPSLKAKDLDLLSHVTELHLEELNMETLPPFLFKDLKSVTELAFYKSQIESLRPEDAHGLKSIKVFKSSSSSISCKNDSGFTGFVKNLGNIKLGGFRYGFNLGCPRVTRSRLQGLGNIQKCNDCRSAGFEPGALDDLKNITDLDIDITTSYSTDTVPTTLFDKLENLQSLSIYGVGVDSFPIGHLTNFDCKIPHGKLLSCKRK